MTPPSEVKPLPSSTFGFVPRLDADQGPDPGQEPGPEQDRHQDDDTSSGDPLLSGRYEVHQFHSEILGNDRDVSVYLPAAYGQDPDRRFPVFYLHDGQNLFDSRKSYIPGCTWRAHITADSLTEAGITRPVILVGVANTGLGRMAEYTPTRDFRMGGGNGRNYGLLLKDELKPVIDSRFRTLTGLADTGLGGSSLGGLITLYLGLEFPSVFGKLAVMSPSLWWNHRSLLSMAFRIRPRPEAKIWLDMGTSEGIRHLRDADMLYRTLLQQGWEAGVDLAYARVEGGLHNEEAWAQRFGDVLRFLFPAEPTP